MYIEVKRLQVLGPYSPTILTNFHSLVLQIFLHLETYECSTTSDYFQIYKILEKKTKNVLENGW